MVMYINPNVHKFIVDNSVSLKTLKGCINFKKVDDFSLDLFKEFLLLSEKIDFSPVLNHYNNKK